MGSVAEIVTALMPVLFSAFAFGMMKYMPSRKEFDMHLKEDEERFRLAEKTLDEIKELIRDTKNDIIREVKNGNH